MYLDAGQFVLQLIAVHFPNQGRLIQLTGEDEMPITLNFTPDEVRPNNIILSNGDSFYMMPDQRRAEIQQMAAQGLFGDLVKDPIARAKYFKQIHMPDPGGTGDSIEKDTKMAKYENLMFKNGQLIETDPFILQQIQQQTQQWVVAKQDYEQNFPIWQQKKAQFDQEMPVFMQATQEHQIQMNAAMKSKDGMVPVPPMLEGQPVDPGPPPTDPGPQPPLWRRARREDVGMVHREEHLSFMKSPKFEELCKQFPKLREAMYFHLDDHDRMDALNAKTKQDIMTSIMPPQPAFLPAKK
jgi:hypothetical protein